MSGGSIRAQRLRGIAALMEALDMIGRNQTDHDLAAVIVDNELELRAMLQFSLVQLSLKTSHD
jgi:hypothetical protein